MPTGTRPDTSCATGGSWQPPGGAYYRRQFRAAPCVTWRRPVHTHHAIAPRYAVAASERARRNAAALRAMAFGAEGFRMARNRFEQVDEAQADAITLSLTRNGDRDAGTVIFPASASGGRLAEDQVSGRMSALDSFRSAIRLANEMKVPIVVMDPDGVWQADWGELFRYEDEEEGPAAP